MDAFEDELASYCGSRYAVAVNSCTNALFLSLKWCVNDWNPSVWIPRRTYIGVLQACLNAGLQPKFWDGWTQGWYALNPFPVIDSARVFSPGCHKRFSYTCVSFHSGKLLPIGRGGAILTDNEEASEWFRAARMDGRPPGSAGAVFPGWHMPMAPDIAARGLDILSRWNDTGYIPETLPATDYPDLSALYAEANRDAA